MSSDTVTYIRLLIKNENYNGIIISRKWLTLSPSQRSKYVQRRFIIREDINLLTISETVCESLATLTSGRSSAHKLTTTTSAKEHLEYFVGVSSEAMAEVMI